MAPKAPNGNTVTSTNSIDVDLKFEQDLGRTWVDKAKFDEFHDDYEESEENHSLNTSSDVQFKVRTYNEIIDDDKTEKMTVGFISMTTVCGGNACIVSFLKEHTMLSVYKREDRGK